MPDNAHSTSHSHHGHHHGHHHHDHHHENHWFKATLGLLWGAALLLLSISPLNISAIAYAVITCVSTLMTIYIGHSIYQSAWKALQDKRWDMTTLYSISTLTITLASMASLFVPGLPMMLEAAPLVLGFWHLGEGIEHTLVGKINQKLDIRSCAPSFVTLKATPNKKVSVKDLKENDIILLKTGEAIPVDGILKESASMYTTRINGSPYLTEFKPGDEVKAGMTLAAHVPSCEMQVTRTYKNSYLSLIAKNIANAHKQKAPIEIFADKVLQYFVPALVIVALGSGIVISILNGPALALQCVTSVLVSACPCALSLITPLAVKIGLKKSSELGIIFNDGKSLQAAATIDTVVFDLNGTLTKGEIRVENFYISDEQYLSHIALLESHSKHPVAKIIQSYIETQHAVSSDSLEIHSIDSSHHSGIKGIINNEQFIIGNTDMLLANGIIHFNKPYDDPNKGSLYVARNGMIIAQISLIDPLREDAVETISELKRLGKDVHICTGSDFESAKKYAACLGIAYENICANTVGAITKPGEKSKTGYIHKLRDNGQKVAMVGDAANDITAIACSDVGIAVKSTIGDDLIQQHAGITIQQGMLFPIAAAFDVAQKTKRNIFQNLFVSLTYNSGVTLVAAGTFGFTVGPALGMLLMSIESTLVLINIYRLKLQKIITQTLNTNDELNSRSHIITNILDSSNRSFQPKIQLALTHALTPSFHNVNSGGKNHEFDERQANQVHSVSASFRQGVLYCSCLWLCMRR